MVAFLTGRVPRYTQSLHRRRTVEERPPSSASDMECAARELWTLCTTFTQTGKSLAPSG